MVSHCCSSPPTERESEREREERLDSLNTERKRTPKPDLKQYLGNPETKSRDARATYTEAPNLPSKRQY